MNPGDSKGCQRMFIIRPDPSDNEMIPVPESFALLVRSTGQRYITLLGSGVPFNVRVSKFAPNTYYLDDGWERFAVYNRVFNGSLTTHIGGVSFLAKVFQLMNDFDGSEWFQHSDQIPNHNPASTIIVKREPTRGTSHGNNVPAGLPDSDDEKISFQRTMIPNTKNQLPVCSKFARHNKMSDFEVVILESGNDAWEVTLSPYLINKKVKAYNNRLSFQAGWSKFYRDNKLYDGCVCLFSIARKRSDSQKMVIDVKFLLPRTARKSIDPKRKSNKWSISNQMGVIE